MQVFQSATLQRLALAQQKALFVLRDMPALTLLWVNVCDNNDEDAIMADELDWDGLCSLTSLQVRLG